MEPKAMRRLNETLETELVDVARHLSDVAREATLEHFRSETLRAENKAAEGWDPVTEADRDCERRMREVLSRRRPNDGILGEEFDAIEGQSGLVWVLDPIDGTRSFVCGTPVWGVLISVSDDDGPLYGIIDQPYIGERFEGGFGHSLMQGNGPETRPLKTRETLRLEDSILFSTMPEIGSEAEKCAFERVSKHAHLTRYGIDCYAYALLALGQIDLVIEAGLQPYDVHAPIAVMTAAGGVVTDWEGGSAHHGGQILAAANPAIHEKALKRLAWSQKTNERG